MRDVLVNLMAAVREGLVFCVMQHVNSSSRNNSATSQGSHRSATHGRLIDDPFWWNDIYRRSQNQGQHADEMFSILHDAFSLGVVLLEVALLGAFVLD
jgi:hypothetical protein